MRRGLVLVEGQTEERFANECLGPYLADRGVSLVPTIVKTRRTVGASHFKGGVTSYNQVRRDLGVLMHDSDAAVITTLLDYYALPADFPGMATRPPGGPGLRVAHVEAAWAAVVGDRRFVPHVVLHEFEAWVYADPSCLEPWMFDGDQEVIPAIAAVAAAHRTPEDIDEGPLTAPSKRLRNGFAGYQKALHGPFAVSVIGIERIRAACPHFAGWLERLEATLGGHD